MASEEYSEFYVYLPSNVSDKQFPNNKTNNYKTSLARPLNLKGSWLVSMVEISYPRSWYSIEKSDFEFKVLDERDGQRYIYKLKEGNYTSAEQIIEHLNNALPPRFSRTHDASRSKRLIDIKFDPYTLKTQITIDAKDVIFVLSEKLANALGFGETVSFYIPQKEAVSKMEFESEYSASLRFGILDLFVYSDIVKETLIGDTMANILGIVTIPETKQRQIVQTYVNPHFVPVRSNMISAVQILLTDSTGKPVKFQYGNVYVKLKFKKRRSIL